MVVIPAHAHELVVGDVDAGAVVGAGAEGAGVEELTGGAVEAVRADAGEERGVGVRDAFAGGLAGGLGLAPWWGKINVLHEGNKTNSIAAITLIIRFCKNVKQASEADNSGVRSTDGLK